MNLVDKGDAEVVVAYTGFMPWEKQMSLTRLGARLLHLPQLIVPSTDRWSCISCFSKLYLFGLEGIYTDILYVNSNMLLSPTLPLSFLFLFSAPENPKFFGAVQSLALADGNFDTSVLLFKPLKTRMAKLVQRAGKFNKTVDGINSEHDF
ncbi:hypothetical protein BCR33DRAFT_580783 [Rhizoclosmatium globosum]|uniref:Uncharacterized protein n=1 Tax=Rhizoclosmatium globosum TaxID=329046 RepID=A0A1Y2CQP0_9FUNG|nr:hypothetical protein BCR33DRAFT_580783 [Rhizoclosmatium globosum]|eukprot:ORY49351.1 hypothetical protein BCR33DRAFT_580783 [Rhizoclosmatium globosum]